MEGYQRAYRDANSPLTPLTPMLGNIFDFDMDASNHQSLVRLKQPTRCSPIANPSPIAAGLAVLGNLLQGGGHRLGSAPNQVAVRRRLSSASSEVAVRHRSSSSKENTPMSCMPSSNQRPLPPQRQKRLAIKTEKSPEVPRINIEPPPRRKRQARNEQLQLAAYDADQNLDVVELSEDANFVRQQQQQFAQYQQQNKRRFDASQVRLSSPVAPKPLSPRLGAFLASWGMNCLKSIFERQEIDIETFCCLTADDLALLGIEDAGKRELVLKAVDFLKNQLRKE